MVINFKNKKPFTSRQRITTILLAILLSTQLYSQIFIEAENFSDMNDIDTQGTSDVGGGLNVGWINNGSWMEYLIDVPMTGEYELSFRFASLNGGGIIDVMLDDNSLQRINILATGDWQAWETILGSSSINLSAGEQTIRVLATTGGFNLNWWKIRLTDPADSDKPTSPTVAIDSVNGNIGYIYWHPSTDISSEVIGYQILRDKLPYDYTIDTSIVLTGLSYDQSINLSIVANDLAGNVSDTTNLVLQTDTIPWELVWGDEFDYTGDVDRTKWNFQVGGGGWGNGEAQYYTDGDNANVANGVLTIEARKESFGGNDFTSTRMNSAGKGDFLFGRIEARAKLPSTEGTWPAFWTLPTNWVYGNWPSCGEIDIMEHSATKNYGNVFGTIHTGAYNHMNGTQKGGSITFEDVTDTYHTYVIEWYPDHIDWYIDENLIFNFENEYKTPAEWPYDVAHHVLINLAIGGGLGGSIDYNDVLWPQQYIIDYVRVYDFKLGENDTIAPEASKNLTANPTATTASLSWYLAKDNYAIEKYNIFLDDELVTSVSNRITHTLRNLTPETEYIIGVQAVDFAGNESDTTFINLTTLAEPSGLNSVYSESISVYPNPFNGNTLTIALPNVESEVEVLITSTDGKILMNNTVRSDKDKIQLTDINLNTGVYFISVISNNEVFTQTIMCK